MVILCLVHIETVKSIVGLLSQAYNTESTCAGYTHNRSQSVTRWKTVQRIDRMYVDMKAVDEIEFWYKPTPIGGGTL